MKIDDQQTSNTEWELAETQEVDVNKQEGVENQHSLRIEREPELPKTKEESSKKQERMNDQQTLKPKQELTKTQEENVNKPLELMSFPGRSESPWKNSV